MLRVWGAGGGGGGGGGSGPPLLGTPLQPLPNQHPLAATALGYGPMAHGRGGQMGNTRGNGQQNPQVLVLQNKRTRVLEGWKPYVFDEQPQMVGWHVVERATSKGAGPIAALGFWPMIYGIVLVPVLIC